MKVLAIESAGRLGGVALADDQTLIAETLFEQGMVHGREIAPTVERLCRNAGLPLSGIDLIAVDIGPGSFTGLRVGLAAAKGLAYSLRRPLVGVPSVDALAEEARSQAPAGATLCAVVDARWNAIYTAQYNTDDPPQRLGEIAVEPPEEFLLRLPAKAFLFGDALERYADRFRGTDAVLAPSSLWLPRPARIAFRGARRHAAGEADDPATLAPLYLRPTEAEVNASKQ